MMATLVVGCAGCDRDASKSSGGKATSVVLSLAGKPFNVEIAASNANRQLGLMYRKSLPADAGMVFVFKREEPLSFWMRNTEIPLDIVYLDAAGRVVSIKQMKPFDESGVPSEGPARYAIELNQGTAATVGLKVGDTVQLPPQVSNPPDLEP